MKRISLILLVSIILTGLSGCGASSQKNEKEVIVGTWRSIAYSDQNGTVDGDYGTATFSEDNTYLLDNKGNVVSGTWQRSPNEVAAQSIGADVAYDLYSAATVVGHVYYLESEDSMFVLSDYGGQSIIYVRSEQ